MKRTYFTILVLTLSICGGSAVEFSPAAQRVLATVEWISIPAGTFLMGSTPEAVEAAYQDAKLRSSMLEQHTFDAELPQHQVYLDAYEISRYEITNAQYRAFIEATDRPTPRGHNGEETWVDETFNGGTQPVVGVTWFDAQAFAEWIGGSLPTEAQWERAARGTEARTYPWGDTPPKARQHANFARRYNCPMPVGQFPKGESSNGIADLAGNVWEWCLDEYNKDFYSMSPRENPLSGADSVDWATNNFTDVKSNRVLRGGSWNSSWLSVLAARRRWKKPSFTTDYFGFRCARSQ
jgi:formylglycine-generating enzyme required for sulfatase activity